MRIYAVFLGCIGVCWALPQSPQILEGNAKFSSSANRLEIETADRTVIEWENFSIDLHELAHFIQPSSRSAVLNRVITAMPSLLQGKLESNGQVVLINPNGILVGKDAVIDTGSFIASTLDVKNQSFLENREFVFEGSSLNGILNEGTITTSDGDLLFIGHTVRNEGHLETQNGAVALLASQQVILKPTGFERIFVKGTSFSDAFIHPDDPDWDTVSQSIHAGTIRSSSSNGTGGNVYLCGEQVLLREGSKIDASGDLGGGNVWLGGEYQGKNEKIENARYTWIEQGVEIDASAKIKGNAGQIIVWADKGTAFHGKMFAQGGPLGGDGGLVEVSGKEQLHFTGLVDRLAPLGKAGVLLLDPNDIDIIAPTANVIFGGGCGANIFCATGTPATIDPMDIITNLGLGPVTITTAATLFDQGTLGNIRVLSPIVYFSTNALTLFANNDIFVNADIQNGVAGAAMPSGAVTLTACRDVTLDSNTPTPFRSTIVGSKDGTTTVTAGRDLIMNGNNFLVAVVNPQSVATQIGWKTTLPATFDTITGNIFANAGGDILMNSGAGQHQGTVIGHGKFDYSDDVAGYIVTADVSVNALGDITLTTTDGDAKGCLIGHGYISIETPGSGGAPIAGSCDLTGNVHVTCQGDLALQEQTIVTAGGTHALIGFHVLKLGIGPHVYAGEVLVNVGGNFTLASSLNGFFKSMGIGTSFFTAPGGGDTVAVTANIGGSITMDGPSLFGRAFIGKLGFIPVGAPSLMTGDVTVNCTGPLLMNARSSQYCFIGYVPQSINTGIVNVTVNAGPINIQTIGASSFTFIGAVSTSGVNLSTMGITTVRSTGNITINGAATSGINAYGDVFVQAVGNINAGGLSFIGTERPDLGTTTTILAGGNIIGTPPAIFGFGYVGSALLHNNSLIMGAGGNIQMPNSFVTTTGTISIAASTSITGFNIPVSAFSTSFLDCNGLTITVTRPAFALLGPNVPCGLSGCLSFDPTVAPVLLQTTSGPIILRGGPQCDLRIGNQLGDDVTIMTTSGDIEVIGSAAFPTTCPDPCRGNSFNNVTINQNICTTGSVLIAANHDLIMEPGSSIGGLACGGPLPSSVTLIVDNENPFRPLFGDGGFFMDATAEINSTGQIRIFTALQSINRINGLINNTRFSRGTLFECTNEEIWCSYFCDVTCPMSGVPFTVAYKNCLPTQQAMIIIDEFLANLHPYNEFPGWMMRFWIEDAWQPLDEYPVALYAEPYMLRRRHLNLLNHPKTWSQMVEDTHPRPLENMTGPSLFQ